MLLLSLLFVVHNICHHIIFILFLILYRKFPLHLGMWILFLFIDIILFFKLISRPISLAFSWRLSILFCICLVFSLIRLRSSAIWFWGLPIICQISTSIRLGFWCCSSLANLWWLRIASGLHTLIFSILFVYLALDYYSVVLVQRFDHSIN